VAPRRDYPAALGTPPYTHRTPPGMLSVLHVRGLRDDGALGSVLPIQPGQRLLGLPVLLFSVYFSQVGSGQLPVCSSASNGKIGCDGGHKASSSLGTGPTVRDTTR